MNDEWFNLFKKYRLRKYNRDLDKLRNDLANRGLAQSSIREDEERWLKEDYADEVAMKREEVELQKEVSSERNTSIWTNRVLAIVAISSFIATVVFSHKTLELNYLPSIDVQYNAPSEDIQVYNRGETNLYIWGSSFNRKEQSTDNRGRLITPSGLPYHFPGHNLNQKLASLLAEKENAFIPFELYFKDNRGEKYVSENYFFVFRKDGQLAIDVQTTEIEKSSW